MPDYLVNSMYVRRLFGGRSKLWVNKAKKSGALPPPTRTLNGRDYWSRSLIHEVAGIPVPKDEPNGDVAA